MINEEKIKEDWTRLDNDTVEEVKRLLKGHEQNIQEYLIDFIASLCDVDKNEMMTSTSKAKYVHARWLLWYTLRYMGESFSKIAQITGRYGRSYVDNGIANSVTKMGGMIVCITVWSKRWDVIKRVLDLRKETDK